MHKLTPCSPSSDLPATVTQSSNAPITVTKPNQIVTVTPTPTRLSSPSCPAANGSTYTATNRPRLIADSSQMAASSLRFEILCDTNLGEGGSVIDIQLIANVSTLNDCLDACALYNFQMRADHFPALACTGATYDTSTFDTSLHPAHTCWLKNNVTLASSNDTAVWPGADSAVLLLNT